MSVTKKSRDVRETYHRVFGEEACGKRGVAKKHYQEWLESCASELFRSREKKGIWKRIKEVWR